MPAKRSTRRKASRKPSRKASRKPSRKVIRKASRKASRKPSRRVVRNASPKRRTKRRTSRRTSRKVRKLPKIKPNESNPCSALRKKNCPGNPSCGWRKRLGCYRKRNVVKKGLVFEGPMFESM